MCSDGGFIRKPWPKEEECIEVETCLNFPKPDPAKLYKPLSQGFYSKDQFIQFQCLDPDAILDDNSGRNYFTAQCLGDNELGYYQLQFEPPEPPAEPEEPEITTESATNATLNETLSQNSTSSVNDTNQTTEEETTQASPSNQTLTNQTVPFERNFTIINATSFEFPKCRRRCSNFYVGRLDFQAVDDTREVRAGDLAEFACREGYYIDAPEPVSQNSAQKKIF